MGIIIKDYEITKGDISDVYVKLNAVRAGMGHGGTIACEVSIYRNINVRQSGGSALVSNGYIHIPDKNIPESSSIIQSVYPLLQEYLSGEEDSNSYGSLLSENILS